MKEIDTALALCFEQNLAALERGDFHAIGPAHKSIFWVEDGGEIRLITAMSAPGRSRIADNGGCR